MKMIWKEVEWSTKLKFCAWLIFPQVVYSPVASRYQLLFSLAAVVFRWRSTWYVASFNLFLHRVLISQGLYFTRVLTSLSTPAYVNAWKIYPQWKMSLVGFVTNICYGAKTFAFPEIMDGDWKSHKISTCPFLRRATQIQSDHNFALDNSESFKYTNFFITFTNSKFGKNVLFRIMEIVDWLILLDDSNALKKVIFD